MTTDAKKLLKELSDAARMDMFDGASIEDAVHEMMGAIDGGLALSDTEKAIVERFIEGYGKCMAASEELACYLRETAEHGK